MKDSPQTSIWRNFSILTLVGFLTTVQYLVDSHSVMNNTVAGHFTQKILVTMTIKKQMRLTPSLSKNFEAGQLLSVRAASENMYNFCWYFVEWIMQPLWFTYVSVRLIILIGPTYFVGLILMLICLQIDKYFYDMLSDQRTECRELHEERICMLQETCENIRTIKLFCWENIFKQNIFKIRGYQIAKE